MGYRKHSRLNTIIGILISVAAVVVIFILFSHMTRSRHASESEESASGDAVTESESSPVIRLGKNRYTYTDDITNYLVIGTDHSGSYTTGGTGDDYHGEMADFLLVISVNDSKNTYTLLPIDRDTMTEVKLMQTDGSTNATAIEQICTAHWYGGDEQQSCENTVDAVSHFLGGLPIRGYYSIGMDSIKEINHAVGGVTVTVQGDFSSIDPSLVEGKTMKLTDDQAFTYVHERRNMPDDNRNSARMARQEDFLNGFITAAKAKIKTDGSFANDLYDDLTDSSVTDLNGHEVSRLINSFVMKDCVGSLTIEGKYREGKILDDDEPHGIFRADKSSVFDCLSTMLGLSAE